MKIGWMLLFFGSALVAGCRMADLDEAVVKPEPLSMVFQDGQAIPVYFPEYLLVRNAQLGDHGRIPATRLVGAEITVDLDLLSVREYYVVALESQGWNTDRMEQDDHSFWMMASQGDGSTVEVRAVQGSAGPTHVFLLYTPSTP